MDVNHWTLCNIRPNSSLLLIVGPIGNVRIADLYPVYLHIGTSPFMLR